MCKPSSRRSKPSSANSASEDSEAVVVVSSESQRSRSGTPSSLEDRLHRYLLAIVVALLVLGCAGCQTASFYSQAIGGQFELWTKRRSIESLLKDRSTSEQLRERLLLVQRLLAFAETNLGLPARGQYIHYVDVGRPFVVWSVYAAPEFSLTPKSWWYPIVGSLDYRGYFSEEQARRYAERLRARGYDVHTGGVTAYSTLGWFRDPVLNTFINEPDSELAELLFHELAHQRLFIPHDTEFNEAFATAVAQEGTRRWLAATGNTNHIAQYEQHLELTDQFVASITSSRDKLNNLYTNLPAHRTASETADARRLKREILSELRFRQGQLATGEQKHFARWFQQDLNNALLNTVETYHRMVPAFRRHLESSSQGNLSRFYRDMELLKNLSKEERRARMLMETASVAATATSASLRQIAPRQLDGLPATRE